MKDELVISTSAQADWLMTWAQERSSFPGGFLPGTLEPGELTGTEK